jgi:hypothetical protein
VSPFEWISCRPRIGNEKKKEGQRSSSIHTSCNNNLCEAERDSKMSRSKEGTRVGVAACGLTGDYYGRLN